MVEVLRVVVVEEAARRGMGAEGDRHHGVDQEGRERVLVGVQPQVVLRHDLLTGDDHRRGRLALLDVGEGEALDAHRPVGAHLLDVDDRHVRGEGGKQSDVVVRVAERVRHDVHLLPGHLVAVADLGREALLRQDVGAEAGLAGDERRLQRPGEEAQRHLIVGVVLDEDLAALDRLAEADAGGGEAAVAAVGDLDARDAAGADEQVERLSVGVRHEVQVADLTAGDLVHQGHRVAVDRESAHGDLLTVMDEALRGLGHGHELAVEAVAFAHALPPRRVSRGPEARRPPRRTCSSALGDMAGRGGRTAPRPGHGAAWT